MTANERRENGDRANDGLGSHGLPSESRASQGAESHHNVANYGPASHGLTKKEQAMDVPLAGSEQVRGHRPVLLYGVLAEFKTTDGLVEAARRVHTAGYKHWEAYTPFPVEELAEIRASRPTRLPYLTLAGGLSGAVGGYAMQYWATVVSYPMNVGGRPLHSWPAYLPVVFELGVLGAALTAVLGMLALNGLPMPYHPLFHIPQFRLASRDRFFLCIEARDPQFDLADVRLFLQSLHPLTLYEVPL